MADIVLCDKTQMLALANKIREVTGDTKLYSANELLDKSVNSNIALSNCTLVSSGNYDGYIVYSKIIDGEVIPCLEATTQGISASWIVQKNSVVTFIQNGTPTDSSTWNNITSLNRYNVGSLATPIYLVPFYVYGDCQFQLYAVGGGGEK